MAKEKNGVPSGKKPEFEQTWFYAPENDQRIRLLKKGIPGLTIVLFIILVLWPLVSSKQTAFTLSLDRLEQRDENAKLVKPAYRGVDQYDRPINVFAERAFQGQNDDKKYYLKDLEARMHMRSGEKVTILSKRGIFDTDAMRINLDDQVHITTEDGLKFSSTNISFDLNEKIAVGHQTASGITPFGTFSTDGFRVDLDQQIIRFEKNVKLFFDQNTEKTDNDSKGKPG